MKVLAGKINEIMNVAQYLECFIRHVTSLKFCYVRS